MPGARGASWYFGARENEPVSARDGGPTWGWQGGLGDGALEALALSVGAAAALARGAAEEALAHTMRAVELRDAAGTVEEDEAERFVVHARALEANGRRDEARSVSDVPLRARLTPWPPGPVRIRLDQERSGEAARIAVSCTRAEVRSAHGNVAS